MVARIRAVLAWAGRALDAILPRPPEQHPWTGEISSEESARRKLNLRIRLLEKPGKGGYR